MGKSARCFDWIRQTIVGWTVTLITPAVLAAADDPFFDLDLHEVLDLEVTSVSKKPQTVSRAAAAVFVITADDIRRSGAMTIPDLLRMAPGIQVGQISANSWAVSSRGPSGRFTNKLLVLIDGRSVYTPTFRECIGTCRIRCWPTSSASKSFAVRAHRCGERTRSMG
ncbi:MAG: TonB-dependent receptor plug domain-containing protein [Candidatus Accumulibacter sp.]|nr:TonB-dependent receptor plug domain-containing protein [Accumulibacter sp.]